MLRHGARQASSLSKYKPATLGGALNEVRPVYMEPKPKLSDLVVSSDGRSLAFRLRNKKVNVSSIQLRDMCRDPSTVDPFNTQKRFATSQISPDLMARAARILSNGDLEVVWSHGVVGVPTAMRSVYDPVYLEETLANGTFAEQRHQLLAAQQRLWHHRNWEQHLVFDYGDIIANGHESGPFLRQLRDYGLAIVENAPVASDGKPALGHISKAVADVQKNTFYGQVFVVKSEPQSLNVANTPLDLGLHMDLLYYETPPAFQMLLFTINNATGGENYFVDSFAAAERVRRESPANYDLLASVPVCFQYRNDNRFYRDVKPTFVVDDTEAGRGALREVNYSPPFQGPFLTAMEPTRFVAFQQAMLHFERCLADPDIRHDVRLERGQCAVFMNRRILHARNKFDESSGERCIAGTYTDIEGFMSKLRSMSSQ